MKPIHFVLLGVMFGALLVHVLFFLQPGRGGTLMLVNLGVAVACLIGLFATRRKTD